MEEYMKPINRNEWNEAKESTGFKKLVPGGYVCRITNVNDVEAKGYFAIRYDIAEGEYAGHYSDEWGESHPYAHEFNRSYTKALGMLKTFLGAVDNTNGTKFRKQIDDTGVINPQDLVGKQVGLVFKGIQKTSNRGNDYIQLEVSAVLPAQDIRDGNFTVPDIEIDGSTSGSTGASGADDIIPTGFQPIEETMPF